MTLASLRTFERGSSLQKKDLRAAGTPCFHYGEVYTHYGVSAVETRSFVDPAFAVRKRVLHTGDLFVAATSENDDDLGKAVAWMGEADVVASNDAYIFRPNADASHVSHFFASTHFDRQKRPFITGTKVKRLPSSNLGKIRIPIPSLGQQRGIVEQLDAFDALVNDLSIGLPSELNARRKQYEYYRDKLLTFKELA